MATIIYAEGWEHRSLSLNDFNAADGEGIADFIAASANVTIVQTNPRNGASCLRVAAAGASTGPEKNAPGANPTVSVVGIGIRFETSLPAANSRVFEFNSAALVGVGRLHFNAATSKFAIAIGGGALTDIGPTLAADTWYWVDLRCDVTTATTSMDGAVDEGANTNITAAGTASTITLWKIGTNGANTFTARYDDFVVSYTAADYPLGKKKVLPLYPNGDGTHNTGGAGNFDKVGGADITDATTDAWQQIDDWITGADDGATTGILNLLNAGSTLYTEHTFDDTTEATVDAVVGTMASAVSSTTAHTATYRIVDSGGSTIKDLFSGDVSISIATHYRNVLVSQNPSPSTVNGYKFRFGFSTDPAPDPQVTAVMLTIVVPEGGAVVHEGEATLQAVASTTIDGSFIAGADALLQAVAFTTVDGSVGLFGDASLQAVAFTTIDGSVDLFGDVTLQAVATFTSDGLLTLLGEAVLQGVATISPDGLLTLGGDALLQAVATLTADGSVAFTAEALLEAVATLDADAAATFVGEAILQAVADLSADGLVEEATRHMLWVRGASGSFYPVPNRRRVRGSNETTGGRIA